jgi:hypothetical protein
MDTTPLTLEEYNELKQFLATIKEHMPDSKAEYVWNNFMKVTGGHEARPCTCGSAGAHWGRAIAGLREWVNSKV